MSFSYYKDGHLSEHKVIEVQTQINEEPWSVFSVNLRWTVRCDHAGFTFGFDIWKFMFNFAISDTRHWDDETNAWEVYDEYQ